MRELSPAPSGVLQRKCSCGAPAGPEGECLLTGKERRSLSTAFRLAVGLLFTATSMCSAQQNRTVRVCVNLETATLGGQITNWQRANVTFLRIQTDALSSHKPDKTRHLVLEGFAVPQLGEPPSGIPGRSPYEKYGGTKRCPAPTTLY